MLEPLFGSTNSERVLMFILSRDEGYTREIARFFKADPDSIHKQLVRLETGGVLVGKSIGRTRMYSFNPRYPFLKPLKALLQNAMAFYVPKERERLLMNKRRPRRHGKPE